MKRTLLALAFLAILAAGAAAETSDFYPLRVDVIKVMAHAEGYRVIYRKGSSEVADVYIPLALFKVSDTDGALAPARAELVRGDDPSLPYMTIFYKDNKFDHLRLYVRRDMRDTSWGVLSPAEGAGKFTDKEMDVVIKF